MQTTEIVERVQERANLDSFQEAHDTVIALLETLALRDLKDEREDFATQLPKELGQVLTTDVPATKERFDASDMVRRVAKHLGSSLQESQTRTHAAFSVLMEAVSEGQVENLLNALSDDYAPYATWDA